MVVRMHAGYVRVGNSPSSRYVVKELTLCADSYSVPISPLCYRSGM